MKRYLIIQPKEQGIYSRGDNVFTQINIKDILTNSLCDPSSVSISIINPCGVNLITSVAMTKTAVGVYKYDYQISSTPTNSPFGIYKIKIQTLNENTISLFNFVLFPWDIISRIREISGFFQQNDISDYKLSMIAWNAYIETLDEIYELHSDETPLCNPETNEGFNGTNITFKLKEYPLADFNGDEYITGFGELACGEDVTFHYIDSIGDNKIGHVVVIDADVGIVTLKTITDTPVPKDIRKAMVSYCVRSEYYDQNIMREAVAYLASNKVLISLNSLDKSTLADLQTNEEKLRIDSDRFIKRYETLIEKIGMPNIGCGK
jgi:hypothetical protein